jgi:mRNA-degrading endonuclease RelE of RelBE toxin-antitoxin system
LTAVEAAVSELSSNPRPYGVENLGNDIHRLRVGDWRIIYHINDKARRVIVGGVRRRNERTYKDVRDLF